MSKSSSSSKRSAGSASSRIVGWVPSSGVGELAAFVTAHIQKVDTAARTSSVDAEVTLASQAFALLGDIDAVATWVSNPVPSLDNKTPLQLIETPEGTEALTNYMNQIRYGVYI